eukprot:COSAG06_NODE_3129_length_5808_cov_1.831144_1_plen_78_part_00
MSNAPIQPPCGGIGYEFLDASVLLGIPSDFKFDRAWGEATLDAILSGPEDPAEYSDWRRMKSVELDNSCYHYIGLSY